MTNQLYKAQKKNLKKMFSGESIRHFMPSMIYSEENPSVSDLLIETICSSVKIASKEVLPIRKKSLCDSKYFNVFPGEHYRLISALTKVIEASVVVEIGTSTGLGTLALKSGLQSSGKIFTYDIVPWNKFSVPSHFEPEDFDDGTITQVIGDLSDKSFFDKNFDILSSADVIFLDAPKDGVFEYKFLEDLKSLERRCEKKILIIDDIRFLNMIKCWRSISSPKVDVTGFGHWSGTGLVDISKGLVLNSA